MKMARTSVLAAPLKAIRGTARKLPERVALHELARDRLRSLIVRGDLAPGVALQETQLSEELLELRSNRSAQIAPLRQNEIDEIFEVISAIEGIAAQLAASRITNQELKRLTQLQERMEVHHDSGKLEEYFKINQEIHGFIV